MPTHLEGGGGLKNFKEHNDSHSILQPTQELLETSRASFSLEVYHPRKALVAYLWWLWVGRANLIGTVPPRVSCPVKF